MTTETTERTTRPTAAPLRERFPGRYLSVTSFKRDGTAVATPVWFVSDGSRLFAITDLHSAKVRRIRHNPHVEIAACLPNGRLRTAKSPATAEVLTGGIDLERAQKLLLNRYGLTYRLVMSAYRIGRLLRGKQSVADGAVLAITVDE